MIEIGQYVKIKARKMQLAGDGAVNTSNRQLKGLPRVGVFHERVTPFVPVKGLFELAVHVDFAVIIRAHLEPRRQAFSGQSRDGCGNGAQSRETILWCSPLAR